jgi:hypothetical protein
MKVLGWGKPHGYDEGAVTAFHALVATNDRGAVVTVCRGRWWSSDAFTFYPYRFLLAGERDVEVTESFTLPMTCAQGCHVFADPVCPECVRMIRRERLRARDELAIALARGRDLIRNAEVR